MAERKKLEEKTTQLSNQLIIAARHAGMADIATSVLHNLGNVLNSVKVSANILSENINNADFNKLVKLVGMLNEHKNNINQYLIDDPKGKLIPEYLILLIESLVGNSKIAEDEVNSLVKEIEKIENIIAMQKLNSGSVEMTEEVLLSDAMDTAIELCGSTFEKNNIVLKKEYTSHLSVMADKFKLLQILVNVLQNAKDALLSVNPELAHNKIITIKTQDDNNYSDIIISDNGVGIPPDNITKIFSLGFSTKKDGHGFGLHTSALAAKELGGTLQAKSDGVGEGAVFTLTLPHP
jgi:signal transduction histidine kinase